MEDIPVRTLDEVLAVCRFMEDFPEPWWIGGGWALDVWAGGSSREHEDIEICVLREAQDAIHAHCRGWDNYLPGGATWIQTSNETRLAFPDFMLHLRETPNARTFAGMPPTFEFLLNDVVDGEWLFLPDPRIRLPFERVMVRSTLGPMVTTPEIVLFTKAYWGHRPKDNHDFERVRGLLSADQRSWLAQHIRERRPDDPWLAHLG